MRFTQEELIFLSDNLLARMDEIGRINASSKEMKEIKRKDLRRLEAIHSVICSEIKVDIKNIPF